MLRNWCVVRVLACALTVMGALALLGGASASAASSDCGVATPANETPVSSYAQLQRDLSGANAVDSTYYLTKSISDSASTPGGLVIPSEQGYDNVKIDLDGCSLSITHPGIGTPAITVQGPDEAPQLMITDSSANDDGTLTVVGGPASSTEGAGAGIEVGAPTGEYYVYGVEFAGGTVHATGGSSDTGATNQSGAGAGIGGDGGAPNDAGADTAGIDADGPATVIATGGASDATGINDGGAGAGIGGGGGGAGAGGGSLTGSSYLYGGKVTTTGGTAGSSGTTNSGAGAGFGGGGGGSTASPNDSCCSPVSETGGGGAYLESHGGTLAVTAGATSGTVDSPQPATGFGPGGGGELTGTNTGIDLIEGTTSLSGEVADGLDEAAGATLDVPSDGTLDVNGVVGAARELTIDGTVSLPSNATLDIEDEIVNFKSTVTLKGTMDVDGPSYVYVDGDLTVGTTDVTGSSLLTIGGSLNVVTGLVVAEQPYSEAVYNAGTINLSGTLTGAGQLANSGAIIVSGLGSIPGNGLGGADDVTISGNIYTVSFSVPSPGVAPPDQFVYADTFADGGESLPAEPSLSGYALTGWEFADGTPITDTTKLYSSDNSYAESVPLTGGYQFNGVVTTTTSGFPSQFDGPPVGQDSVGIPIDDSATVNGGAAGEPTGTVQFYVCGPEASATGCSSMTNPVGSPQTVGGAEGNPSAFAVSPSFTPTAAGTYCFLAVYSGDPHNTSSSDGSATDQCFGVDVPTVTVSTPTSSVDPTYQADTLQLSTTVTPRTGSDPVNSGQVAFFVNGDTTVCTADVVNGVASCDTASLPVGTDKITARYDGSVDYGPSNPSSALTETIQPLSVFAVSDVKASGLDATSTVRAAITLSGRGTLRVAVAGARHTAARTERVTAERVTVSLSVRSVVRALAREHPTAKQETLKLTITFTPRGGRPRTVTRSIRVTLRKR